MPTILLGMATNAPGKQTTESVTDEKPPTPSEDEVSFPLSRVLQEAFDFTGHSAATVSGAYDGVDLDTEITKKDAKARINQWLKAAETTTDTEG